MTENQGLVGKLKDVSVGDLVVLMKPKEREIGGYVTNLNTETIKLSHENPLLQTSWGDKPVQLSRGDRSYFLANYEAYEVLKKYAKE